jgi:GH35 family endo-1,4-beta-xylanase
MKFIVLLVLAGASADGYNFDPADHYVAFGAKHRMFIVGHCQADTIEALAELDIDVAKSSGSELRN